MAATWAWRSFVSTLPASGLGLHNDLQNEHSVVGNNVGLLLMLEYGSEEQKAQWLEGLKNATAGFAFGITEPEHGSDATYMETGGHSRWRPLGDQWGKNLEYRCAHSPVRPGHGAHIR